MAKLHEVKDSFRLNMNNPQHVKINNVLKNLNPAIYKSKNQFLIEACQFYIDHYGDDEFLEKEQQKKKEEYLVKDDLEKMKEEVMQAAMTAARQEVIRLLGEVIGGMMGKFDFHNTQEFVNPVEKSEETKTDEMTDEEVAGLALNWMEKED